MSQVVGEDLITGLGFIGLEPGRIYRMRRGPKVTTATVRGNPAVLENSVRGRVKGLTVYGKSTQVTTSGSQLLNINSQSKSGNVIAESSDNGYIFTLSCTVQDNASSTNKIYKNIQFDATHLVGKTVTMSYDDWSNDVPDECGLFGLTWRVGNTTKYQYLFYPEKTKTVTIPSETTECRFKILLVEGASQTVKAGTYSATIKGLMVCEGSTAKSWEPYTGMQPSPSPDYPQEIVNAGNDNSLNITLRGKNLIDYKTIEYTQSGWFSKHSVSNNVLTISAVKGWTIVAFKSPVLLGEKVSLSFKYRQVGGTSSDCDCAFCVVSDHEGSYAKNVVYSTTTPSSEWTDINISFFANEYIGFFMRVDKEGSDGTSRIVEITDIQLELGNQSTEYEPYRTPQTLSIETPNGLPGIPVSSGGNYTDDNGQQWICDEVDLERGVYVQRVKKQALKAADFETVSEYDDDTHWYVRQYIEDSSLNGDKLLAYKKVMCSKAIVVSQSEEKIHPYPIVAPYGHDTEVELRFRAPKTLYASAAEYAADLDGCVVAYPLAMPIETPLADSDLAVYKSLRTYYGTTVVEASDGAGLCVSFGCNLTAAEKDVNKVYASLMAEMEDLNENSKTL